MEKKMDEEMLQVRMLGGFSVTYKGIQIAGGPKARESQFAYLMQMLLYHGRKGGEQKRAGRSTVWGAGGRQCASFFKKRPL